MGNYMESRARWVGQAAWRRRGDLEVWALTVALAGTAYLGATSSDEATWLYAMPALALVNLAILAMCVNSGIKRRQRWKEVMDVAQAKVCPDWFVNEAMEKAAEGGFRPEFTQAFLSLGHPPTGVEVAKAYQTARSNYLHGRRGQ